MMRPALLALTLASPAIAADLTGWVDRVIDGDTLVIGGFHLRLEGLHAPEPDTPEGQAAGEWMRATYGAQRLHCQLTGRRSFERWVAVCYGSRGEDIAGALIAAGLGRDCPAYSRGRYATRETKDANSMTLPDECK